MWRWFSTRLERIVTMDMFEPALLAQLVVAASVAYVLHITFVKQQFVQKQRARQTAALKTPVKQRSERWAA